MKPLEQWMVDRVLGRYPAASDITAGDFEALVGQLLQEAGGTTDDFSVELHPVVRGVDGSYDFDAVATFEKAGLEFKVIVEAKRYRERVKREHVQVLYQKQQSVGAHKSVLVATSGFQVGAVEFARTHGIALATVVEGRMAFETRSATDSEHEAMPVATADGLGVPRFVLNAAVFLPEGGATGGLLSARDGAATLRFLQSA